MKKYFAIFLIFIAGCCGFYLSDIRNQTILNCACFCLKQISGVDFNAANWQGSSIGRIEINNNNYKIDINNIKLKCAEDTNQKKRIFIFKLIDCIRNKTPLFYINIDKINITRKNRFVIKPLCPENDIESKYRQAVEKALGAFKSLSLLNKNTFLIAEVNIHELFFENKCIDNVILKRINSSLELLCEINKHKIAIEINQHLGKAIVVYNNNIKNILSVRSKSDTLFVVKNTLIRQEKNILDFETLVDIARCKTKHYFQSQDLCQISLENSTLILNKNKTVFSGNCRIDFRSGVPRFYIAIKSLKNENILNNVSKIFRKKI